MERTRVGYCKDAEYKPEEYKIHKTTKGHFELFKKEILRLIDEFRISGLSIYFQHTKLEGDRAAYKYSDSNMNVTFALSTELEQSGNITDTDILRSARHEFSHFLVGSIDVLAYSRFCTEEEIQKEFERFAVRLEQFITRKGI